MEGTPGRLAVVKMPGNETTWQWGHLVQERRLLMGDWDEQYRNGDEPRDANTMVERRQTTQTQAADDYQHAGGIAMLKFKVCVVLTWRSLA